MGGPCSNSINRTSGAAAGNCCATASSAGTPPPLDRDLLIRRCLGRLDLVDRLLKSFESKFPEDLSRIEACLRANDGEQLSRLVHQAKGAAANISAPELHANVSRLEQAVKSEERDVAASCLADVQQAWHRFIEFKAATATVLSATSPTL